MKKPLYISFVDWLTQTNGPKKLCYDVYWNAKNKNNQTIGIKYLILTKLNSINNYKDN